MSSWSLVVAPMQVNVSIGSCAIIGENSYDWATSRAVWRSQCSESVFVGCRARLIMALTMSSQSFVAAKMHV